VAPSNYFQRVRYAAPIHDQGRNGRVLSAVAWQVALGHRPGRHGGTSIHRYTLQRADATTISGTICRYSEGEFAVGDRVTVLVDPSGRIPPETQMKLPMGASGR
jgi:hypothetical protein